MGARFQARLPVHDFEKPCTGSDLHVRDNPRSTQPRLPAGPRRSLCGLFSPRQGGMTSYRRRPVEQKLIHHIGLW